VFAEDVNRTGQRILREFQPSGTVTVRDVDGEVAPISAVRWNAIEPPESTRISHRHGCMAIRKRTYGPAYKAASTPQWHLD